MNSTPDGRVQGTNTPLLVSLYVLAAISATTGLLVGVWQAVRSPQEGNGEAGSVMAGLLTLIGGFIAAGLLWAVAAMVRQQEASLRQQRKLLQALKDLDAPAAQPPDSPDVSARVETVTQQLSPLLQGIREQVAELNTNMLLSSEQREAKRFRKQSQRAEQLARQVRQGIRTGNYDEAEDMLERLIHEIPDDPHLEELRDRIEEGREQERRRLVQQEVRRTADLMAVARFDEAIDVAREIENAHGEEPEAQGLLQRVMREAETYEYEQRRRLYSQITACGEARQWKLALDTAHRLLEKFPDTDEAEQVRRLMPTLVDNARIEEVRGLRDRILDMVDRRRYAEACQLALHVTENYPETAAAEELRAKLPRLRELAAQAPGPSPEA